MNKKANLTFLPIFFILVFAAFLRLPTFFLSHTNFDEVTYVSLALKLDKYGFNDFENNFGLQYIEIVGNDYFRTPIITDRRAGNITIGSGVAYEAKTPTHRPPGFSFLLMLSHKAFSAKKPYFVSNFNFNPYFYSQFYACIVPYIFSLLLIFATYILGRMLFSDRVGLYAALFLAAMPTELMVAHKIWAETALTFFITMSAIFYLNGIRKNKIIFIVISGIFAGMATLCKASGGFIIITILIYHYIISFLETKEICGFLGKLIDRRMVVFLASFLTVSGWWLVVFMKSKYSQNTVFTQQEFAALANSTTSWIEFVQKRPGYAYIVNTIYQFPILVFSFFFLFGKQTRKKELFFLLILVLLTFLFLSFYKIPYLSVLGKEERYLMPAYPAMAILASYGLLNIKEYFLNKFKAYRVELVFSLVIILSLAWSLNISIPLILSRRDLFSFPI